MTTTDDTPQDAPERVTVAPDPSKDAAGQAEVMQTLLGVGGDQAVRTGWSNVQLPTEVVVAEGIGGVVAVEGELPSKKRRRSSAKSADKEA
jgi:hypothetical protein